jgi:hypothetical protein
MQVNVAAFLEFRTNARALRIANKPKDLVDVSARFVQAMYDVRSFAAFLTVKKMIGNSRCGVLFSIKKDGTEKCLLKDSGM